MNELSERLAALDETLTKIAQVPSYRIKGVRGKAEVYSNPPSQKRERDYVLR